MRCLPFSIGLLLAVSTCLQSLQLAFAGGFGTRVASAWMNSNSGSDFCSIAGLQLKGGFSLSPSFNWYIKDYTCSCPTGQNAVQFLVTLGQPDGGTSIHITKDNQALFDLSSGVTSSAVTLNPGKTTVFKVSTSCSACNSVYTITCTPPNTPPTTPPSTASPPPPPGTGGQNQPPPPPPGTGGQNQPPPPPPGVIGDPLFTGLLGQVFQVHGVANEVYNLVSTPHMQMNAKFVFLDQGECPVVKGVRRRGGCYSHPGSYLGEVGVKTSLNDRLHIVSGDAEHGFTSVTFNDKELVEGELIELRTVDPAFGGWVSRNDTHTLHLELSKFRFIISNSDMFVNQRVGFESLSSIAAQSCHGLLGQTWSGKEFKHRRIKEIEGTVDDYRAPEQNLWSDEFIFNRFGKE